MFNVLVSLMSEWLLFFLRTERRSLVASASLNLSIKKANSTLKIKCGMQEKVSIMGAW